MAASVASYAAEIREYLTKTYIAAGYRVNEAVDRHSFRVGEGYKLKIPYDEVADEIAGVERWVLR